MTWRIKTFLERYPTICMSQYFLLLGKFPQKYYRHGDIQVREILVGGHGMIYFPILLFAYLGILFLLDKWSSLFNTNNFGIDFYRCFRYCEYWESILHNNKLSLCLTWRQYITSWGQQKISNIQSFLHFVTSYSVKAKASHIRCIILDNNVFCWYSTKGSHIR